MGRGRGCKLAERSMLGTGMRRAVGSGLDMSRRAARRCNVLAVAAGVVVVNLCGFGDAIVVGRLVGW